MNYTLVEDDYQLKDPTNEAKFGFKLSEALARSKENGGKLFAGLTFHVTPKVGQKVEVRLLKNVVTAGGGQVYIDTIPPLVRWAENWDLGAYPGANPSHSDE